MTESDLDPLEALEAGYPLESLDLSGVVFCLWPSLRGKNLERENEEEAANAAKERLKELQAWRSQGSIVKQDVF